MTPAQHAQRGNSSAITLVVIIFVALVAAGTWAAYTYGGDHVIINGRTVDQLEPWEVIGGVIIGILGAVFGLAMGVLGLVIGLVATVASIALALAGVAAGMFITAGVLLGPFLLLAAIILLLRRSKEPEPAAPRGEISGRGETDAAMAKYWT